MDENDILNPEEEQDFTLEDILREFGSDNTDTIHDDVTPELLEDIPLQELLEDLPVAEHLTAREEPEVLTWTPRSKKTSATADLGDTQAFAAVTAVRAGDTQRIDTAKILAQSAPKGGISDDTQRFTPVGENVSTEPASGKAEPFSQNWEPEYDQPIGEYTPPEPIIFRPRSRLGELKRKLMEGPEQRYYALSEKGVGKLQIALFVSMLIVVLAVASIVLHRLDMVLENRMRLLVFGELFAMLVSALLCWERLADGIGNLFKARFNTDTLLVFSFAACIVDGVYCLQSVKVPFCAAFTLQCLMCLWSEYQERSTELCQMDTLRKATRLSRIIKADGCYDGRPGFRATEGQPEDFMDTYQIPTAPQKILDRYTLIALAASIAVALAAGLMNGFRAGIHTWSAAILAACPATLLISQSRPAWTLQRRLHRFGSVICGESVLVGSLEFLKSMGVEPHAGIHVNQAVYIAIDGEFSCVFALAFGKLKGVKAGLSALCGQRRLTPVLASSSFLLDEGFLRSRYGVDTRRMAIPDPAERERLAAWQPNEEGCVPCALTTQEGLTGAAFAITGARSLRIAAIAGAAVHILGGTVGLAAVLILTVTNRVDLLTPANLLLLELIWAVPGLMFTEWTRNG